MFPPLTVPSHFRVIAHRGAAAYAPENTLSAFRLAYEMQAREFEMDAQLTRDGQVVLCHDLNLEKYGHGARLVERLDWVELAGLDMGSWFSPYRYHSEPMLRLADLFEAFGKSVTYHIEIKGQAPYLPQAVCDLVCRYGLVENCIIIAFSLDPLLTVKEILPEARLGWLVESISTHALEGARRCQAFQLCPHAATLTTGAVAQALRAVSEVRVWGLKGAMPAVLKLARQAVDCGCHGATTDWPDWLRKNGR